MVKRIWFKLKYYTALRLGLGYEVSKLDIMKAEAHCPECCGIQLVFDEANNEFACPKCDFTADIDCEDCLNDVEWHRMVPKLYTTRTHRLSGEYYVVEGSRFKAKPVEPRIEFVVANTWELNLKSETILGMTNKIPSVPMPLKKFMDWDYPEFTIPELDLGFRGANFTMLREELLRLNKKATIETPFYINKLEPIVREKPIPASYIAYKEAQIGALP